MFSKAPLVKNRTSTGELFKKYDETDDPLTKSSLRDIIIYRAEFAGGEEDWANKLREEIAEACDYNKAYYKDTN